MRITRAAFREIDRLDGRANGVAKAQGFERYLKVHSQEVAERQLGVSLSRFYRGKGPNAAAGRWLARHFNAEGALSFRWNEISKKRAAQEGFTHHIKNVTGVEAGATVAVNKTRDMMGIIFPGSEGN